MLDQATLVAFAGMCSLLFIYFSVFFLGGGGGIANPIIFGLLPWLKSAGAEQLQLAQVFLDISISQLWG